MSDLQPFQLGPYKVMKASVSSMELGKSLKTLIEKHLDTFLGVTFPASEYFTDIEASGHMDSGPPPNGQAKPR